MSNLLCVGIVVIAAIIVFLSSLSKNEGETPVTTIVSVVNNPGSVKNTRGGTDGAITGLIVGAIAGTFLIAILFAVAKGMGGVVDPKTDVVLTCLIAGGFPGALAGMFAGGIGKAGTGALLGAFFGAGLLAWLTSNPALAIWGAICGAFSGMIGGVVSGAMGNNEQTGQ